MMANNVAGETAASVHGGAVGKAAVDIRSLILQQVLLPGVQVRQEDLASQIGMSRGPIREALQILAAEGVLSYERNRGYFVTRFSADEMRQLYLIRDLLESEVLSALPALTADDAAQLKRINEQIRSGTGDVDQVIVLNHQFHDLIFSRSSQNILKAELEHVGRMTIAYQSLSLNALADWDLVADDHDLIIDALEACDSAEVVRMSRVHRERTLARLTPMLR